VADWLDELVPSPEPVVALGTDDAHPHLSGYLVGPCIARLPPSRVARCADGVRAVSVAAVDGGPALSRAVEQVLTDKRRLALAMLPTDDRLTFHLRDPTDWPRLSRSPEGGGAPIRAECRQFVENTGTSADVSATVAGGRNGRRRSRAS